MQTDPARLSKMFAWNNFAWNKNKLGAIELPDLTLASIDVPHPIAKSDLTQRISELENRIIGGVEYATTLFDRSTIERYLGYLRNIYQAMVADNQQAVDLLTFISSAERHRILVQWNATQSEYPRNKCIFELF